MQHLKKIIVPAVQEHAKEVLDFTSCDLCGKTLRTYHGSWVSGPGNREFNVNEVTIEHRLGNSYPECGSTTTTSFDVCGKCFADKVIPWMESQGAKPTENKEDW